MMDHLDPYEQQLLKVFDNHDLDRCGSLDRDGLLQLCQTLQLEEQGTELVKCLLKDKHSRATFTEFKDALLALLGNMQNSKSVEPTKDTETNSPEREVSPKYVYGSKKYGRRSRPRSEEITSFYDGQNDSLNNKALNNTSVQRSNSQIEVSSKKRKTNTKLKRCTSLPGHKDLNVNPDTTFIAADLSCDHEVVCTEEMLREAWNKLGVGKDGYLNQTELILVCDAIGLHKLADGVLRQLSDKLNVNFDHKISFQELLETLKQDETWTDVLDTPTNLDDTINLHHASDDVFPDSRTFQFVTLGPDGNGCINTDTLIEMWDTVGIHSPKELIHELGFNSRLIAVKDLADVLEQQLKGMNESTRHQFQSPHLVLLQANLALYQSEIRCLKNILEQMQAEREKLKGDVSEANNRATMLAQEVDDHHTRMEQNTINQVRLLEQRHADILREVTSQYSRDKEQLSSVNQSLEEKIACLESETAKLKNDIAMAHKYSCSLEKENIMFSTQICELEKSREVLTEQIELLENEKQNFSEIEREESEMLMKKLNALQIENSQLKDKNDEMVTEIENLTSQMASMKSKMSSTPARNHNVTADQSMEENISMIFEGVGIGSKRRSECSPTKDNQLFGLADGSPRLGKVRKQYHRRSGPEQLEVPLAGAAGFASNESGFDTEPDASDSPSSHSACAYDDGEEVTRLRAKVAFLEQVLTQHNIPVPERENPESNITTIMQLTGRVKELEKIINDTKAEMSNMIDKDCINCDRLRNVCRRLEETLHGRESMVDETTEKTLSEIGCQTDLISSFEEKMKKLEEENQDLTSKCTELENCVELLRNEYEKCEDYWQSKLDEERQFFEAEQKISTEKLTEVLVKMREYEEQYANQEETDNRLQPIPETENLEKQFTDLEQEFEEYKSQCENELFKKDEEISILKQKLTELALKQRKDAEVQVEENAEEEERLLNKMRNFSTYVIENTSRFSDEMLPPQTSTIQNNFDYSTNNVWRQPKSVNSESSTTSSLPINWNFAPNDVKQENSVGNPASTSSSQNSTPCRPKRTRKHDKNVYKKNNQEKDNKKVENTWHSLPPQPDWRCFHAKENIPNEHTVILPLSSFQSLSSRRNFLEQRVRHLQICLKEQHYHNQQTINYLRNQIRGERADLYSKLKYFQEKLDQQVRICNEQLDKLQRTDLLVKDLYVENAYLFANVERLEKQCRLLAQSNTNPNSV